MKVLLNTPFQTKRKLEPYKIAQLGFCQKDLDRAPNFELLKPVILEAFKGNIICSWNADSDLKWFPEIEDLNVKYVCEMKRFSHLAGIKKYQKLKDACYLLNIPNHNKFLHTAVEDAKKLALCSRSMDHLEIIYARMKHIRDYDFPDSNRSLYLENRLMLYKSEQAFSEKRKGI